MKRYIPIVLLLGAGGAGFVFGCDDKAKKDPAPVGSASAAVSAATTASASAATSASASASAAAADDDDPDLVTGEEDMEDDATTAIDDKNFESELDKLEKDIGK